MKFYKTSKHFVFLVFAAILASSFMSSADVTLPRILGSGMVLQCDLSVPIWGWANANEKISVTFAGQTKTAKTGENGKWMVKLDPLEGSNKPSQMTIEGKNKITLENILVGEVWICSGQSNMEWPIRASMNPKEEISAANYPQIRLFDVPGHTTSPVPNDKAARPGSWRECSPKTAPNFSAVGYFFGRR